MKKYLWTTVLVLNAIQLFSETNFERGNNFYIAERYKQAVETYTQIIHSGKVSSELYFNLANSYFRLGDYANAILYYERAKRLSPKDDDIRMNLGIANTRIKDKFETMPDIFFVKWWKLFAGCFSRDLWAIIFLALVFIGVLFLAQYFYGANYHRKKSAFFLCFFLICSSAVAMSAAIQQHNEQTRNAGIIMKTTVNVSSSPEAGKTKFTIHSGTKVDILDELGDFYRIRVANGDNGWIAKEELEKI